MNELSGINFKPVTLEEAFKTLRELDERCDVFTMSEFQWWSDHGNHEARCKIYITFNTFGNHQTKEIHERVRHRRYHLIQLITIRKALREFKQWYEHPETWEKWSAA